MDTLTIEVVVDLGQWLIIPPESFGWLDLQRLAPVMTQIRAWLSRNSEPPELGESD